MCGEVPPGHPTTMGCSVGACLTLTTIKEPSTVPVLAAALAKPSLSLTQGGLLMVWSRLCQFGLVLGLVLTAATT